MMEIDFNPYYYPLVGFSLCSFLFIYKIISPKISTCFPKYKELTVAQKIDWDSRIGSTIHALLVSAICIYIMITDDELYKDPVWCFNRLVRLNCAIVIGYMLSDMVVMIANYSMIGEVFFLLHHCASIYAYFYVMSFGALAYFANFRLIAELSTPFVNMRWYLDILGFRKTSTATMVNGIMMAISFFLVRIAVMPFYWGVVWSVIGTEGWIKLGHIRFVLIGTCTVLDIINVFWFYKIARGAYKLFTFKQQQQQRRQQKQEKSS